MGQNEAKPRRPLCAAIVGCGGIAQVHAGVLSGLKDVRLAACADIVPEWARELAGRFGAGASYGSLEEMLEKEDVDVLHICTPHALHVPMAEQAAGRGIGVFMEKPPAVSREQLERLFALEGRVSVGICFQNRYNRTVRYVWDLLRSGRPGKILGARAFVTWSRDREYYESSGWRGRLLTGRGGVLINQAVHTLDLVAEFMGAPSFAEAHMANRHLKDCIEVEDTVEAYVDFRGRPAVFYATTAYSGSAPALLELCCERAAVRIEESEVLCRWEDGRNERVIFPEQRAPGKKYWGCGHGAIIRDFYDCLETGRRFPVGVRDVRNTMELMLGIYESCRENRVVRFQRADPG